MENIKIDPVRKEFDETIKKIDELDKQLKQFETYPVSTEVYNKVLKDKKDEQDYQELLIEDLRLEAELINTIRNSENTNSLEIIDISGIEGYVLHFKKAIHTLDSVDGSDANGLYEKINNITTKACDLLKEIELKSGVIEADVSVFIKKIYALKLLAGELEKQKTHDDYGLIENKVVTLEANIVNDSLIYEHGYFYKRSGKAYPSRFYFKANYQSSPAESAQELENDIAQDMRTALGITMLTKSRRDLMKNIFLVE